MPRVPAAVLLCTLALASAAGPLGCKRSKHARIATYTPPPLPAGFVEQNGGGWRVAVPSTWKDAAQKGPAAWAVADPQAVDDFHANVNVVTEPFAGDSYDYAHANEAALRKESRATVEIAREDVVDGDPTLILESRWAPASPASAGSAPSPASSVAYRTMQTALASRGTGYVVTCSVSANAFERYRSTCESIIRSFAVER